MGKKDDDSKDDSKESEKKEASKESSTEPVSTTGSEQPAPPALDGISDIDNNTDADKGKEKKSGKHDDHDHHGHDHHGHEHWHHLDEALEAVYSELVEVRQKTDQLLKDATERKLEKRYESAPVRTSDLMNGFQTAVSRANRSSRSSEYESEDIGRMIIKDLEISVEAPLIESGHAQDPVLMLPNIKSVDNKSSNVSIKFSIQSLPAKKKE